MCNSLSSNSWLAFRPDRPEREKLLLMLRYNTKLLLGGIESMAMVGLWSSLALVTVESCTDDGRVSHWRLVLKYSILQSMYKRSLIQRQNTNEWHETQQLFIQLTLIKLCRNSIRHVQIHAFDKCWLGIDRAHSWIKSYSQTSTQTKRESEVSDVIYLRSRSFIDIFDLYSNGDEPNPT